MEFGVLGPLVVRDDAGAEVSLPGTRLRSLLALLCLRVGEVVAADRLVDELWGDEPPGDPPGALQTQVSRLRRALRAGGLADGGITTRPPGYALEVDPRLVDAHRFEASAQEGRALLDAGDPAAASALLTEALERWRGEPLGDLDEDLARAERARLRELRRLAIEERVDADLAAGRHRELVGELEALVADEPLRERRTAQLMLALYRSGRQADALRAFQATRTVLSDELGLEPGGDLRRLEAAILGQDPALDLPAGERPAPVTTGTPLSIPSPLSRLIGRGDEIVRIEQLLTDHRLVTLVGPGGAGKTRLAVEVARRVAPDFAGGAAMVELASVEDPTAVVGAVARAVGTEGPRNGPLAGAMLAELLRERELVLVFDNCEHVVNEVAEILTVLLGRCSGLSVLATSRQGLGLPGEASLAVPPLDRPAAVALFAERAGEASTAFVLDERNRPDVERVCARLDDLPLALELAASRMRVFTAAQLAERLSDRFSVVGGGARGALPRQQTLRAVVDWSYDLLDDQEQRVFERLSVFAGGCTLDAAESVCAGDGVTAEDVAEVLGRLVDRSLVGTAPAGDHLRFTMLQTLSDYGRERLAARGDADRVRRRLADWLLREATAGEAQGGPDQLSFALRFGSELDNVRVGLAWAVAHEPELAVDIAARLVWFWIFNDAQVDGFRALSAGLAAARDLDDDVHARALTWAGALAAAVGELDLADRWSAEALDHARRTGDLRLAGRTACLRAERLVEVGSTDEAAELMAEARRCLEAVDDAIGLAYLEIREGVSATFENDADRAYSLGHRALQRFRELGDVGLLIVALQRFGECADACGCFDEASDALEEALARNEGLPGLGRRSQMLARLARVRVHQGRADEALALAEEAVALARRQTWGMVTGMAAHARGRALRALGRVDEAVADLELAVDRLGAVGGSAVATWVEHELQELRVLARG